MRVSVWQHDCQLDWAFLVHLKRETKRQFAGFSNSGARLLAVIFKFLYFVCNPDGRNIRKENRKRYEARLLLPIALDDKCLPVSCHAIEDLARSVPEFGH